MSTEIYLDHVKDRLQAAGFDWRDGSQMEGPGLLAAASKSGFELTNLGISEDFFVFGGFDNADINAVRDFSAGCSSTRWRLCTVSMMKLL